MEVLFARRTRNAYTTARRARTGAKASVCSSATGKVVTPVGG